MTVNSKFKELSEEFRTVFSGRTNTMDAVLPPLVFLISNALFGFKTAMWVSLILAGFFTILRLSRRQPLVYAVGGLTGVGVAIGLSLLTQRAENYFLPAIISSSITFIACLVSALVRKPLAAFASHLTRAWTLKWFWHPKVRTAYIEVTLFWALFIALRLALQIYLYLKEAAATLAWVNIVTGWPVTITVLAFSYIYGIWRLQNLKGPSVDEFIVGKNPPWEGQKRGF